MQSIKNVIKRNIKIIGADPATAGGFTQVPNFILTSKKVGVGAKLAYSMLLKYLRPVELQPLPFLGTMAIIGTLVLTPLFYLNPFNEPMIIWNDDMLKALAYIAIFPSIISYMAWNYGIQKLGASIGGQFIHLMPLFGALMAVVFLGEEIQLYHLIGGAGIALGLWLSIQQKTA